VAREVLFPIYKPLALLFWVTVFGNPPLAANISDSVGRFGVSAILLAFISKPKMNVNPPHYFNPRRSSSDYWVIENSAHAARPDLGLDEGEAARLALKELEKVKGSDAHRLSLVPAIHSPQQLHFLFQNLDKCLFREVLKSNISLRFSSNLPPSIHGSTSALGVFGNQIVISLNSDLMRHPASLAVVASLIHQMSHAYLLVCCGFGSSRVDGERHDLKHGLAFSSIVHTIQDLLFDDARIPLPDLFNCGGLMSSTSHPSHRRAGRKSLHSYCYFDVSDHEDKIACGAYMRHVIAVAKASTSNSPEEDKSSATVSQSIGTLATLVNRLASCSLHLRI
jgi:SprT-like family